ncbi:MAG: membrane protein insertase YidC [Hyphomicrobiaceae bacterium]
MQQPENNRNFILAIVLSMLVLIGWQVFYAGPRIEEEQRRREQLEASQKQPGAVGESSATTAQGTPTSTAPVEPAKSRAEALATSPRITIDTPALSGTIALKGGRIDDLVLRKYQETTDKTSPNVTLLSPSGTEGAFYAEFGWTSPTPGTKLPGPETIWTAEGQTTLSPSTPVTLAWDNGEGLIFRRSLTVDENYMFTVRDEVRNTGAAAVSLIPYGLVSRHGEPHVAGYYVLHEGFIGIFDSTLHEYKYTNIADDGKSCGEACQREAFTSTGGWLGITDKYWAAAVIPNQERPYHARFTRFGLPETSYQADYALDAITIAPGATEDVEARLFAGAKEVRLVDGYEDKLGIARFNKLIDWGWFHFLTRPLFYVIDWIYKLVGNFGLAILGVTVLVKLLFFPLANKSYAAMSKMKLLQPEMQKIQERFKDDRMKQQQAIMELYKKEKVSPLSGCLPIIVQIPVFFALYKVLFITIEMRHAPFFGWIKDLSAPDPTTIFNLFGLIPWQPPHILMLGIWPLIMGVSMWLQMKLNPPPPDPVQARIFAWMPVIFTFMLGSFPAGLVIYWAWNNTLSILQQSYIMSRHGVQIKLWDNLKDDIGWIWRRGSSEKNKA